MYNDKKMKELEAENRILREKVKKYEAIIAETEKYKEMYKGYMNDCKVLAEQYQAAIHEMLEAKNTYTGKMEKEILNLKRYNKKMAGESRRYGRSI